jgi:DMSO/TMAO reductase YedYZ molybdopterin-dependent catalytic subunit
MIKPVTLKGAVAAGLRPISPIHLFFGPKFIKWSRRLVVECREIKLDAPWPPNQVKAHRFVIYDVFDPPDVPFEKHVIRVVGAVEKPLEIPLKELVERYPCVDLVAPFHCVTGWSVERVVWRGVQTKILLEEARPYGRYVLAWGVDGYSASLPLEALLEETSIIAWAMNGEPLPKKHGAPSEAGGAHPLRVEKREVLRRVGGAGGAGAGLLGDAGLLPQR